MKVKAKQFLFKDGDHLRDIPTQWFKTKDDDKHAVHELARPIEKKVDELQERLFAEKKRSVLIVLQGLDTSGKDGTVKHIFRICHPQGLRVFGFKEPTQEEMSHDFLWRIHKDLPAKGEMVIFNRSHYEDYVVPAVHKTLKAPELKKRIKEIRHFEALLADEQTKLIKIFLHVSRKEQALRIQARLDNPQKHWKFSMSDLKEREYWNQYQKAYAHVMHATHTRTAPWYVVPADNKPVRDLIVSEILAENLQELDPQLPKFSPQMLKSIQREVKIALGSSKSHQKKK